MMILDKTCDNEKSKISAKFYKVLILKTINLDEFIEMCEVLEQLIVSDINLLIEINSKGFIILDINSNYRINRLNALGLIIKKTNGNPGIYNIPDVFIKEKISLSYLGNLFTKLLLE